MIADCRQKLGRMLTKELRRHNLTAAVHRSALESSVPGAPDGRRWED